MPRLRRSDKRKYDRVTIELRCVLANAHAAGDPDTWVAYWGSPEEARRAWNALRSQLEDEAGQTYEAWLKRIAQEPKRRGWLAEAAEDEGAPDEDAAGRE